MRGFIHIALALSILLVAGCSPSAPTGDQKPVETEKKPAAEKADSLPSDVPIPIGLEGRKDSTQPGSGFFVVQGQIATTVPDAATAVRRQAEDAGWTTVGEPAPSEDGSVEMLIFEKEARSLKITLVKVQNTLTGMNLLTGPK